MATKGIQSNGIAATNAAKAAQGQQDKADARRARKAQKGGQRPVVTVTVKPVSEEALHALFSQTGKVLAENHITRSPGQVLAQSRECIRACRLHGWVASLERIARAAMKHGLDDNAAHKLGMEATRAFRF